MNDIDLSSKNASNRRPYFRRNRKKNRTDIYISADNLPVTTTIVTANSTLLINSSSVPINDLFAPISYITQHKYFFLIALSFLIFLCVISILFLAFIFKCTGIKSCKARRQERLNRKRLKKLPDFLDDQHDSKGEHAILLQPNGGTNHLNNITITTNGMLINDNISNTFSIDPLVEQKIMKNNPPHAAALSPSADDTSIDTLRGSLISSPSQQVSINQQPSTPTKIIMTDSIMSPEEPAIDAEKDDDLHDLDLKPVQTRYVKATNNSGSNLLAHRGSASSIEHSIRKQERRAEEEERGLLHGSNSNLYEKELRRQADQEKFARKEHTNSQVSLVSRTSEDSCY